MTTSPPLSSPLAQSAANSSQIDPEKLVKWGIEFMATMIGTKKLEELLVDHNRKDTALVEFEKQHLSFWDEHRLKDAFRDCNFYVTKFPDTDPEI